MMTLFATCRAMCSPDRWRQTSWIAGPATYDAALPCTDPVPSCLTTWATLLERYILSPCIMAGTANEGFYEI